MRREITSASLTPLMPAVKILAEVFGTCNSWAITGSSNLAIRGARIRPSDMGVTAFPARVRL
jgi:hypothetical protein